MGIPIFGALGEALDLEEVHGERFFVLADYLARIAQAALGRCVARRSEWRAARDEVSGSSGDWAGPNAAAFRADFARMAEWVNPVAESKGEDGFVALSDLARTARQVGDAIDRAQLDHRNRLQGIAGWANEGVQRIWTNVQDVVGAESDADAQRTREAIDQTNRSRELAESVVHDQLMVWRRACEGAASAVAVTAELYDRTLSDAPAARGPVTAAPASADLVRRWIDTVIRPYLEQHRDDPAALAGLWARLSPKQRHTLMTQAPDLVERYLLGQLNGDERSRFLGLRDALEVREQMRKVGLDPDRFDPAQLGDIDTNTDDYRALVDLIARRNRDAADDPARAAEYLRNLGVEGLRAQIGLLELGLAHAADRGPDGEHDRVEIEQAVTSTAAAFAVTTGDPGLADLRERLLDVQSIWQLHQLSLLLSADPRAYDPAFVVRAVDVIDAKTADFSSQVRSRTWRLPPDGTDSYPVPTLWRPLYSDPQLAFPTLVAFRTLAGNDHASWQYLHNADGTVNRQHLDRLLRFDAMTEAAHAYNWHATTLSSLPPGIEAVDPDTRRRLDDLVAAADRNTASALDTALRMHATDDHNASYALYVEAIRSTAAADISPHAKRVLAARLAGYLDHLANDAWLLTPRGLIVESDDTARSVRAARNPTRPELVDFFASIGGDREATRMAGLGMAAWAAHKTEQVLSTAPLTSEAWRNQVQQIALMTGAARNGLESAAAGIQQAAKDFGDGTKLVARAIGTSSGKIAAAPLLSAGVPAPFLDVFTTWAAGTAANEMADHLTKEQLAEASKIESNAWGINDGVLKTLHAEIRIVVPEPKGELLPGWNDAGIGDRDESGPDIHWDQMLNS